MLPVLQRFQARQAAGKMALKSAPVFADLVQQRQEIIKYLSSQASSFAASNP
jgi:hypothetical protein